MCPIGIAEIQCHEGPGLTKYITYKDYKIDKLNDITDYNFIDLFNNKEAMQVCYDTPGCLSMSVDGQAGKMWIYDSHPFGINYKIEALGKGKDIW